MKCSFKCKKTRLNSDTRHGIGKHLIDVAAEVGVEAVALLVVIVVLTGCVLNEKREHTDVQNARARPKSLANGKITGLKTEQQNY